MRMGILVSITVVGVGTYLGAMVAIHIVVVVVVVVDKG
jgi:hypothetical protein